MTTRKEVVVTQQIRRAQPWLALAALLLACAPVSATEDLMESLPPVVSPFECLICHQTNGDAALNAFGQDFLANDLVWNDVLAEMNSDGDECTNGVELGDVDGDGQNEGNIVELQNNPGENDCAAATVDGRTWGELKALFDRN
jgi:hypothetical protein